jgi:hypothetical protein
LTRDPNVDGDDDGTNTGARRVMAPVVAALVALGIGLFTADQLNRALRVTFEERPIPSEDLPPSEAVAPGALDAVQFITLPRQTGPAAELLTAAASVLADASASRTGQAPLVRTLASDARRGTIAVSLEPEIADGAYRIAASEGGITIRASTALAAVHGMAFLTERLLSGAGRDELNALDRLVTPAFENRFVDLGGVGILPDSAAWAARDYSHHNRAFIHVLSAEPPFLDAAGFEEIRAEFRSYVRRMALYGYDGIVFKGFLEFVDFDRLGNGFEVYARDSAWRERHGTLRRAFGELFEYARSVGMKVVLSTDMVALTPPLEAYLIREFGSIDAEDPALWEVYRLAAEEVFDAMPVDGLMIRVGETGAVFNLEGWDYHSQLHVRTRAAMQQMLRALTAAAEPRQRTIYFRTWSVGIGETGGMHTRPDVYVGIFDELNLPGLVVSTKYSSGDFYSWLPLNPTLGIGQERRMVELQARREYDGFGAFPNLMAPLHRTALQQLRAANPQLRDVWVWTQEGGPLRASPRSLYPFHGFWQLIDADVWLAARLAWDPEADVAALTRAWVRRELGGDSAADATVTDVLLASRGPVRDGLYIEPFARRQVHALGLEPPPMLWIFEWDIVTGSSAALSTIYLLSRDDLDAAIARGHTAVAEVGRMRESVDAIAVERVAQPELLLSLRRSLAYQQDLFGTLAAYRETFLSHYRWLDTGSPAARAAWRNAEQTYRERKAAHVARYGDDLDFRAYSFHDADTGLAHADRSPAMAWLARLLILAAIVTIGATHLVPLELAPRTAVFALPLTIVTATSLTFSSFLSVALPLLVTTASGTFAVALHIRGRGAPAVWRAAATMLLSLCLVLLVPLAVRGPGFFWLQFWTNAAFRSLLVVSSFVVAGVLGYFMLAALERSCGSPRAAAGRTLFASGAPLLAAAALAGAVGLERALSALNNELAVLPMGLSAILGITTHLDIPLELPRWIATAGAVLVLGGAALQWLSPARTHRGTN